MVVAKLFGAYARPCDTGIHAVDSLESYPPYSRPPSTIASHADIKVPSVQINRGVVAARADKVVLFDTGSP